MDQRPNDLLRRASRSQEISTGTITLLAALFMGYWGLRGVVLRLNGSHAAPADPVAATIGIGVGLGGAYFGLRMLFGWHENQPLVPTLVLILAGCGALAGAVWFVSINRALHGSVFEQVKVGYVFGLTGVAALILGWRRLRRRDP